MVERHSDKVEVEGPIPSTRTKSMEFEVLKLVVYFVAGIVQDFFFTLNTKYVAENKVGPAVFFSFLTIFVSMIVLYNILSDLDAQRSFLSIIVYCVGIAFGTYMAMKFPFKFKKK